MSKDWYAWLSAIILLSIIVLYFGVSSVAGQEEGINGALTDLSLCWANYTMEDSVSNLPILFARNWYFRIVNLPDETHLAISNPNITIETDLILGGFYPDPTVSCPPIYQWIHGGTVSENYWFTSTGFENKSQMDRPRFSASRLISPERLNGLETNQTVEVTLSLEEPLPPEVNELAVAVGFYPVVTEHPLAPSLVDYDVLEWSSPESWEIYHHGPSALQWAVFNMSEVVIGETYVFNATFRVEISEHLVGSVLSKPYTTVIWRRIDTDYHGMRRSISLEHPEGVKATYQTDEELGWSTVVSSSYRQFNFAPHLTSIVGDEPPFNTLSNLVFTLRSCADLHIYDAIGGHVGLNYDTKEIETLIPEASFELMDGDQIVTMHDPLPGDYRVLLIGTSSGSYELLIEGATQIETFFTEKISGLMEPGIRHETGIMIPRTVGRITINELTTFCILVAALLPGLVIRSRCNHTTTQPQPPQRVQ